MLAILTALFEEVSIKYVKIKSMKLLLKRVSIVTIGISLSRILGYFRDIFAANFFGASVYADSFYAAYRIPNLFRRMFGEGAISASFVPVLKEYVEQKDKFETQKFIDVCFTALLLALLLVVIMGIIFARELTGIIAYGFRRDALRFELTASLTQVLFPFLLFVCLTALMMSILVTFNIFFIPSASSGLINISEILYMLMFLPFILSAFGMEIGVYGLALSVVFGGFLQCFVQFLAILKKGYKMRIRFDFFHPGLRKVFFLLLPVIFSFSIEQINMFVDTVCASFLEVGSMTALYYSNRLILLPLALFGTSTAIVNLPILSSYALSSDFEQLRKTLNFSIRAVSFIIVPAMFGLMFLGFPIVRVLFERGEFTIDASRLTYLALFFYCFGLVAFSIVKILSSLFYALKLPKVPVKTASICMVINAVLNVILMQFLRVGGLALATSISAWVNVFLLFRVLRRVIGSIGEIELIKRFFKFLFVGLIMGVFGLSIYGIAYRFGAVGLFLTIFICIGIYAILSAVSKFEELKSLVDLIPLKKVFVGES